MIWSDKQTVTLLVRGEEIKVEYRVPSAIEYEELIEELQKQTIARDSVAFVKFVTHIDGFNSAEECVNVGGTKNLVRVVYEEILKSASIDVELKN